MRAADHCHLYDHVGTAALGCPGERFSSPIPLHLLNFGELPTSEPRSFAPPDSRGRLSPRG